MSKFDSIFSTWIVLTLMIQLAPGSNVCLPGQFSYGTNSTCTAKNCPGSCVDVYMCCADECFDINNLSSVTSCNVDSESDSDSDEIKCRNTLQEIKCIANISQSTFEICLHQVSALVESGSASIGTVDPVNCPCEMGFTKVSGSCPPDCADDVNTCYNTSDVLTNQTTCCINNTALPSDEDCEADERIITSVISLNYVSCTSHCIDTCRLSGSDRLPACCRIVQQPVDMNESQSGLSGGIIALIVILVVAAVAILLVITIRVLRKRK